MKTVIILKKNVCVYTLVFYGICGSIPRMIKTILM